MAYVDHAFSISDDWDEDIMMGTSYIVNNKPPIKEISLALALFVFGALGIVLGILMVVNIVGGDRAHGGATRAPIVIDLTRDGSLSSKSIILQIDSKSQQVSANYSDNL